MKSILQLFAVGLQIFLTKRKRLNQLKRKVESQHRQLRLYPALGQYQPLQLQKHIQLMTQPKAILLPPPAIFSTTTAWPIFSETPFPIVRARVSRLAPAGTGTMILIDLLGQESCAKSGLETVRRLNAKAMFFRVLLCKVFI